jgi:hypothetical protein
MVENHGVKRLLYYALVIWHPVEGEPSLPVAEHMCIHRKVNICAFIYNGHISFPRQVNTDYSWAILLAVLKKFNNETMVDFLARTFRIVNRRELETDLMLIVILCISFTERLSSCLESNARFVMKKIIIQKTLWKMYGIALTCILYLCLWMRELYMNSVQSCKMLQFV